MTPKQKLIAILTMVLYDVRRYRYTWIQSFVPPVIMTILYFLVFGKVVGTRVGAVHGMAYIAYIMPGLVIMPVIIGAYTNGAFNIFISKLQRSIQLRLLSPISDPMLLTGYTLSCVLRGLVIGMLVYMTTFFFVHIPIAHTWLALFVMLFSASLFAILGCLNGILARNFESISVVPTFILTPLIYLGGVFYAVSLLPHWAQVVSLFNPIYYIVVAFKYAILAVPGIHIDTAACVLLILNVVAFIITCQMLRRSRGIRP